MMIRSTVLAILIKATSLSAALFCPMDTTQPLQCCFALHQHNRILIEDGRIKKIIYPEEKLYVRLEEISGQLFIQAKNPFGERIAISVISQSGMVQDLEIEFSDQPSQVVILQEKAPFQPPMIEMLPCLSEDPKIIVEAILHGTIPQGYCSLPFTQECKAIRPGVHAKLVGRLKGSCEELYIYQIHNTRIWKKRLTESHLASCKTGWVYLQKICLAPKERILALVAVQP